MKITIKKSKIHGKGIFAAENMVKGETIEICPVIVLSQDDTGVIGKTIIDNYYFSWKNKKSAIALGYGSMYNHSYKPNTKYEKDFLKNNVIFTTLKPIKKGEEITVNYNGKPNSKKKVWFDKK